MSRKRETKGSTRQAADIHNISLLSKISRSLEILVRLNLHTMRGDRSQTELISMLDAVGCGQTEIADLLRTPSTLLCIGPRERPERNERSEERTTRRTVPTDSEPTVSH